MFSCNFANNLRTPLFIEHLQWLLLHVNLSDEPCHDCSLFPVGKNKTWPQTLVFTSTELVLLRSIYFKIQIDTLRTPVYTKISLGSTFVISHTEAVAM